MKTLSLGSISKSTVYLSIERHRTGPRYVSFGKTYVGTVFGIVASMFGYVLLFHIRNPRYDYKKG